MTTEPTTATDMNVPAHRATAWDTALNVAILHAAMVMIPRGAEVTTVRGPDSLRILGFASTDQQDRIVDKSDPATAGRPFVLDYDRPLHHSMFADAEVENALASLLIWGAYQKQSRMGHDHRTVCPDMVNGAIDQIRDVLLHHCGYDPALVSKWVRALRLYTLTKVTWLLLSKQEPENPYHLLQVGLGREDVGRISDDDLGPSMLAYIHVLLQRRAAAEQVEQAIMFGNAEVAFPDDDDNDGVLTPSTPGARTLH